MIRATIQTPLGTALLEGDESGLRSLNLKDTEPLGNHPPSGSLKVAATQLQAYFMGTSTGFNLLLNPNGTLFQQKVWDAVMQIPWGKQVSYLELATSLGNPKAVRAVAAAIGKNPLLIIIPCHRVIGSSGALTGYSAGLWRKKWLLGHEQTTRQTSLFELKS